MEIRDLLWVEQIEGKEKPSYNKVGILIIKDDGKISVRINTLPRQGVKWDGWLAAPQRKDGDGTGTAPAEHSGLEPF